MIKIQFKVFVMDITLTLIMQVFPIELWFICIMTLVVLIHLH